MKPILYLLFILLFQSSLFGQIHKKNQWLICPDKYYQQLFIYDIKSGKLVKSFFIGDKIRSTTFNEDETILFVTTKKTMHIINLSNFDDEKKELLTTTTMGTNGKGLVVYYGEQFINFENKTINYLFQDLNNKSFKIASITEPHQGICYNQEIFIPYQEGNLKVINVNTKESKWINQVIDSNYINEVKAANPGNILEYSLETYGPTISVTLKNDRLKRISIYDLIQQKIGLFSPYLFQFEQLDKSPIVCINTNNQYYCKTDAIDKSKPIPARPIYPETPDYDKIPAKDVKKAVKEFDLKVVNYEKELVAYEIKYQEFNDFHNLKTFIFDNIDNTNALFSVEGAKFIHIDSNYLISEKEDRVELYDLTTKKLAITFFHTN